MKIFLAALGWLLLFAALGVILLAGTTIPLAMHRMPPRAYMLIALLGAAPGLLAWIIALCFALLPGARPRRVPRFGLLQGLWAMGGTIGMMFCGALLPLFVALFTAMELKLRHVPAHIPGKHDLPLLAATLLASELLGLLWVVWYMHRQGAPVAADGSARGIAWRAAAPSAYGAAVLCALVTLVLAGLEFRFVPPDLSKLHNLPLSELYQGPPAIAALVLLVMIGLAPFLEEILFRGVAFAGIATRLGPLWAVLLTTSVFTALHAPEKIYYPLGFLDVALIALFSCALRLRYHSIKPGILLHFLYNFGMLAVPTILAGT